MSSPKVNPTEAQISKIRQAAAVIAKNIRYHYTIPVIADEVGLNEFLLKTLFKMEYGIAPFQYLTNLRMERAIELMDQGHTIQYIARAVGYDHATNFCAAFRRRYGVSPKNYKKS